MQTAMDRQNTVNSLCKSLEMEMHKRGQHVVFWFKRSLVFVDPNDNPIVVTYTWLPTSSEHRRLQVDIDGQVCSHETVADLLEAKLLNG